MADLRAERDVQLDTFGEQRVVAPIGRRSPPQPRQHAQPDESFVPHSAAQFADRRHRSIQIDGCQAGEPGRVVVDPLGDLIVGDEFVSVRPAPCGQQTHGHAGGIHRVECRLDRRVHIGDLPPGPAQQRREHVVRQKPARRVLEPHVDRHR
jgi:hypothetical protein